MPPPDRNRKSRLDQNVLHVFMASPGIDELVEIQQHVREIDERPRLAITSSAIASSVWVGGRVSAIRYARSICLRRIVARLLLHAVGEQLRLPQHELIVEQRQRLRRHRRHVPRAAA